MNKDPEQFFEDLAKSYPELMEKSSIGEHIGVGAGWFSIIDALCSNIYSPLYCAKSALKAAVDYPRNDNNEYLNKCESMYAKELEELPEIVQIKEKFGDLRFYIHNGTDRVDTLIRFAESMSRRTCEECGKPGTIDDHGGWFKTHCEDHTRKPASPESQDGRVSPKFQDDEV
jgi:hypothetical protein